VTITVCLAIKELSKSFGGLAAVEGVGIEVRKGEIVSIIGPNGAGKTTVFNMITGFYRPDHGSIRFDGQELSCLRPHEITRAGIARTFQNIRLFPDMTVMQNLIVAQQCRTKGSLIGATLRSSSVKQEESANRIKLLGLLEFFNLQGNRDLKASALAYGEQRRLEIARALSTDPKLLLLDEPTAGMNLRESEDIIELISKLRKMAITILLIEHNMNVVMKISERIFVLDHGMKIAEGTPREIQGNDAVIKAYLGDAGFSDVTS
jgi:branched-chain amino acid transport system ATP-binding protein